MTLKVVDFAGKTVRELAAPAEAGLHRVDLEPDPRHRARGGGRGGAGAAAVPARGRAAGRASRPNSPRRPPAGGGRGGFGGRPVSPGTYRVVLTVDGKELAQALRVEADPDAPASLLAEEGKEAEKESGDDDEEERGTDGAGRDSR